MKFTTKSSLALVALLAASTVGGTAAFAANGLDLDSTGKVEVGPAKDTGDDKIKTLDPETKGYIVQPTAGEMVVQQEEGPIKIERVPNLNFETIQPQANVIVKNALDFGYKKIQQQLDNLKN